MVTSNTLQVISYKNTYKCVVILSRLERGGGVKFGIHPPPPPPPPPPQYCVELTHWGRETHICVGKLTISATDNGLSSGRRQAIIWTNAGILLIETLGTNFNEILIEIHTFSFKKMHLKISSAKWRPFCLGLNMLSITYPCPGCMLQLSSARPTGCLRCIYDLVLCVAWNQFIIDRSCLYCAWNKFWKYILCMAMSMFSLQTELMNSASRLGNFIVSWSFKIFQCNEMGKYRLKP